MRKILLVSYCEKEDIDYLKKIYKRGDILVAVDQGCKQLIEAGLFPHYIVGDFDSFTPPADRAFTNALIRLEKEKEESDLDYAVNHIPVILGSSFTRHPYEIIIINNMQGRLDHILSALYLLKSKKNISIQSAKQKIFLIERYLEIKLPLNTTISLIPISKEVSKVSTKGLYYPLFNETLYRNRTRGLSNISIEKTVQIEFNNGELLCVINNFSFSENIC